MRSRKRHPIVVTPPVLLMILLTAALGLTLARRDLASAIHDPAISYYWPDHGWASQAHSQGHDGYGPYNTPTYYGGTATGADYWFLGSVPGEDACTGQNRWPNMNVAEERSETSTTGQPQLPDWPVGLYMSYAGCGVNPGSHTQFTTFVVDTNAGTPGYLFHIPASPAQCSSIGLSYKCGDWATVTQAQKSWWNAEGRTDVERRKFLLHEWGHAWNMGDYCGDHNAMSKNGTSSCPWPAEAKYYDLDDRALYLIYGQ